MIRGFVKVIEPNGNPVIGIGDGKGRFAWIPTEEIIGNYPEVDIWQEVIFKIRDESKIKWKEENNFDKFKWQYTKKGKPLTQIPPEFIESVPEDLAHKMVFNPIPIPSQRNALPPDNLEHRLRNIEGMLTHLLGILLPTNVPYECPYEQQEESTHNIIHPTKGMAPVSYTHDPQKRREENTHDVIHPKIDWSQPKIKPKKMNEKWFYKE